MLCSTLGVFSAARVGPVWVMGTKRSEFCCTCGFSGAVTVRTPSDDRVDDISLGLISAVKKFTNNTYYRMFHILVFINVTWQLVASDKMPGYVAVLISLFFVLALDNYVLFRSLYSDLIRRKLLNVQNNLQVFRIECNSKNYVGVENKIILFV